MKNYKIIIFGLLLFSAITSCHDDLDTVPLSTLAPENFFNDLQDGEIAVNGVYDKMADHYDQNFIYMSDHGSHVATITLNNRNLNLYGFYTFNNSDRFLTATWETAYEAIYRANVAINRVTSIETEDETQKNRIIAEARFLRALAYFNLVRFYGDVPLVLEEFTDFQDPSKVNRSRESSSVVYDAIISDLKFAEDNLYYASWITEEDQPSYEGGNLGRATIGAAKGLLAKVYLTRASFPLRDIESYQLAYDKAKEVIDQGHYSLDPDYTNLNTLEGKDSKEWLFQIQYNALLEQDSRWGGIHNPLNEGPSGRQANDWGYGRVSPTLKLARAYEEGDLRLEHNIAKGRINADGTINYINSSFRWFSHKYRFSSKPLSRFNTDMNAPILRYADILLIYAEAANELALDGEAYDALDEILLRVQDDGESPALVNRSLTGSELKEFIFWERAREVAFEGHSKFDIIRAGEDKFLEEVKGQLETTNENNPSADRVVEWSDNVQPYHLLFPIPAAEISANPNIEQNEGY